MGCDSHSNKEIFKNFLRSFQELFLSQVSLASKLAIVMGILNLTSLHLVLVSLKGISAKAANFGKGFICLDTSKVASN